MTTSTSKPSQSLVLVHSDDLDAAPPEPEFSDGRRLYFVERCKHFYQIADWAGLLKHVLFYDTQGYHRWVQNTGKSLYEFESTLSSLKLPSGDGARSPEDLADSIGFFRDIVTWRQYQDDLVQTLKDIDKSLREAEDASFNWSVRDSRDETFLFPLLALGLTAPAEYLTRPGAFFEKTLRNSFNLNCYQAVLWTMHSHWNSNRIIDTLPQTIAFAEEQEIACADEQVGEYMDYENKHRWNLFPEQQKTQDYIQLVWLASLERKQRSEIKFQQIPQKKWLEHLVDVCKIQDTMKFTNLLLVLEHFAIIHDSYSSSLSYTNTFNLILQRILVQRPVLTYEDLQKTPDMLQTYRYLNSGIIHPASDDTIDYKPMMEIHPFYTTRYMLNLVARHFAWKSIYILCTTNFLQSQGGAFQIVDYWKSVVMKRDLSTEDLKQKFPDRQAYICALESQGQVVNNSIMSVTTDSVSVRNAVRAFFDFNNDFLKQMLAYGRLTYPNDVKDFAWNVFRMCIRFFFLRGNLFLGKEAVFFPHALKPVLWACQSIIVDDFDPTHSLTGDGLRWLSHFHQWLGMTMPKSILDKIIQHNETHHPPGWGFFSHEWMNKEHVELSTYSIAENSNLIIRNSKFCLSTFPEAKHDFLNLRWNPDMDVDKTILQICPSPMNMRFIIKIMKDSCGFHFDGKEYVRHTSDTTAKKQEQLGTLRSEDVRMSLQWIFLSLYHTPWHFSEAKEDQLAREYCVETQAAIRDFVEFHRLDHREMKSLIFKTYVIPLERFRILNKAVLHSILQFILKTRRVPIVSKNSESKFNARWFMCYVDYIHTVVNTLKKLRGRVIFTSVSEIAETHPYTTKIANFIATRDREMEVVTKGLELSEPVRVAVVKTRTVVKKKRENEEHQEDDTQAKKHKQEWEMLKTWRLEKEADEEPDNVSDADVDEFFRKHV